ncbi:response regulator transcription factor [Caproicibacter fermentans]|uniref:Stage 0 sporulation protein A homolog n=1 Tax=Caproicibacter fermentans TaxID=2576756 RepID=A0A7G8TAB2_9FIRM|nr:response regulator [Caproicibacter fermentans]QNK40553.1 response regulator [Caproicibacter fermentans]
MYSLMIVDDEPLMVKYFKNSIERIAPEWQVSGIALDGLQAVELLQRQSFELVVTDIRMPEMDGLELAKFISEIYPQTRVVIISGFDDFDYAQRAIRCGVSDYLLKPISDQSIADTLKKISEQIRSAQSKLFSEDFLFKEERLTDPELRSRFLSSVIHQESPNMKSIYSVMAGKKMELLQQAYSCVGIIGVDSAALMTEGKSYQETESYQMRLNQTCMENCKDDPNSAVCYCDGDNTAVLICSREKEEMLEKARRFYKEVRSQMERDYSVPTLNAIGTVEHDILCLRNSYEAASQNFILAFLQQPGLSSGEEGRNPAAGFAGLASSVYSDYISGNDSGIYAGLKDFFQGLPDDADPLVSARFGLSLLQQICKKGKVKRNRLERGFQQLALSWQKTRGKAAGDGMADAVYQAILALNQDEKLQLADDGNHLAERAKEYIAAHYSEPISLTLIAEKLGVSSSYLSDLFHREVGEPYSKFVTRVRMEQAIMRMKADPNKKIYTLAAEVGFINSKHFNSVFKKFYHVTPTEYFKTL